MDGEISLEREVDGSTGAAAVLFRGYAGLLSPSSDLVDVHGEEEEVLEDEEAVLGDDEEAVLGDDEEAVDSEDDDDDDGLPDPSCSCEALRADGFQGESGYDSDDSEEESDGEVDVPLKVDGGASRASSGGGVSLQLIRSTFFHEGRFLGQAPRFASAGNTAGFMRVAAVEADHPAAGLGRKQILVLYRYTRFAMARKGGVEMCRSTKLHQLRFVVPPAGDAVSSLPWAGSSLAPLIYPSRFSKELQALWSALVSTVTVPPRATRVQVFVDAGILQRGDYTPKRMEQMRAKLEDAMAEPWPGYHVGMELHLPEPVRCATTDDEGEADDDMKVVDGGERPAKRRKVEATGQECPVCFDLLESDLAAWPGCSLPHVFHGGCLELSLKESEMCPICRRKLSTPLV